MSEVLFSVGGLMVSVEGDRVLVETALSSGSRLVPSDARSLVRVLDTWLAKHDALTLHEEQRASGASRSTA